MNTRRLGTVDALVYYSMSPFAFDQDKLIQAALETECSPLAIEEGTGLAEAWLERGIGQDWDIAAVECGFVWWADEKTVIVGVQDLLTNEPCNLEQEGLAYSHAEPLPNSATASPAVNCIVGNEWKTTKESSKWWNEDKWLEDISEGSQIAIYALALQNATYYPKTGSSITPKATQGNTRIRVKAISKSNPPVIWPRREEDGIITFTPKRLEAQRQALLSEAESIRARRKKVGLDGVWRVPGIWCTNKFKRVCQFHEDCVKQRPASPTMGFDPNDPAFKLAVPHIDKIDNDIVILSASSYGRACECVEAYRRGLVSGDKERSLALDTGTVFHAVVGQSYQQLKDYQLSNR